MNISTEVKVWILAACVIIGAFVAVTMIQHHMDAAQCKQAWDTGRAHVTSCAEYWRTR